MKIQTMLAVALAALVTLSGCSKEETPRQNSGTYNVLVQISKGDLIGRAEADKVSTTDDLTLGEGDIFFTDLNGVILRHVQIKSSGAAGDDEINLTTLQGSSGALIANVESSAKKCYILMKGTGFALPSVTTGTTNISDITVKTMTVNEIYNSTTGGVENIPLWGIGDMTPVGDGNLKTEVELFPMGARLQIEKLTGVTDITSFSLAGIYVNNYFNAMPISYKLEPAAITDNKSDVDLYSADNSAYPTGLYDDYTSSEIGSSSKSVTPTAEVWAYNIWPTEGVESVDATTMPHLVIKLIDVVHTGSIQPVGNPMYLTVKGMKTQGASPTSITKIEKGNSYTFTDITFKFDDLTTVPEVQSVNATVKITPMNWKDTEVDADLD